MAKQNKIAIVLLLITVTIATIYFLSIPEQPEITGMSPSQVGRARVTFGNETPPPPPPPRGGGGGGKAAMQVPCPSPYIYETDDNLAGLLFADYDPEMEPVEIVTAIIDKETGDKLKAVFIDKNCEKITEAELGNEQSNGIISFSPKKYVKQPAKIIIHSIRGESIVNNPIAGKIYTNNLAMNLLGAKSTKPWKAEVDTRNRIAFDNEEWEMLPNRAFSTILGKEYQLANIFAAGTGAATTTMEGEFKTSGSCIETINLPAIATPVETKAAGIKSYMLGKGYGTGTFSGLTEASPVALFGNPSAGRVKGNAGRPDNRPQSIFAATAKTEQTTEGMLEDWILITNIGDELETIKAEYYDGETCARNAKDLILEAKQTTALKATDFTLSKINAEGALIITSSTGKRDLIVEKYGVLDGQIIYKTNAMSPARTSEKGASRLYKEASREFMALVPTTVDDQDFTIKIINLPAIKNIAYITQNLRLHVTDGRDNWRTFTPLKTGCVIEATRDDLQEWGFARTWLTHPYNVAIYGQWELGGPIYATDVLTSYDSSTTMLTNEPSFQMPGSTPNCCSDKDCSGRWNLGGYGCEVDEFYADNVCKGPQEEYLQAKKAPIQPPLTRPPEELPSPPEIEEPGMIVIPYTTYAFPWWYFVLAIITLLILTYLLLRKSEKPAYLKPVEHAIPVTESKKKKAKRKRKRH